MRRFIGTIIRDKSFQYFLVAVIPLLLLFGIFKSIVILHEINKSANKDISVLIELIKNSFHILFFLIATVITILSYLQARKTLFTPIRTEVFKFQMKGFEQVLLFFHNNGETNWSETFDFPKILALNAQQMLISYIRIFFKAEITLNEEKMKKAKKEVTGSVMSKSYAEKYLIKTDYFKDKKKTEDEKEEITNPALILDRWRKYEHGRTDFTKKYIDETAKLAQFMASPLLPTNLKELIGDFKEKVDKNLSLIGEVVTEVSQEMPEKFPTAKSVENFTSKGLWNIFNDRQENLEKLVQKILSSINEYLQIEKLIE